MSTQLRLTEVFESAREIQFDDSSKFIFFSDCHRGDNSWIDDFAPNANLFLHALNHNYNKGFSYIEIGDGDELWELKKLDDIRRAHRNVFFQLQKYHATDRLHLIWGNHDIERKKRIKRYTQIFENIEINEGMVLKYSVTGNKIFVVHGHQGDLINDSLWPITRFFSRYFWKYLQLIGFRDPTSPAKNLKKRVKVENNIIEWVNDKHQMVIAGHTHRPSFPDDGQSLYFNDGSCVSPRHITGIEIQNGEIMLVKWAVKPKEDGALYIIREILAGPKKLNEILAA
jgi:UDP-2,3-diacylglucosamine pyrophosphatase LpxH